MPTGLLQRHIDHFRAQVQARVASAEQALNNAHAHTTRAIQPQLDRITRQIAEKRAAGDDVPVSWLYEQHRLQATKNVISQNIDHFGSTAQLATKQLQEQGAALGGRAAQAQLASTVPKGVNWTFGVPHPAAIQRLVGAARPGSPLADLFAGFGKEAADQAGKALITGLSLGDNPTVVARLVQDALDISRQRALTIARTEMLRAYRGAALENYRANDDVVDGWIWIADMSARTCAACIFMHGSVHGLDEDMDSHVNCRCSQSPHVRRWSDVLGIEGLDDGNLDITSGADWFENQDTDTQRAILGARYDGWSNGDFSLKDIVGHSYDPTWGGSVYVKSLKELSK